MDDRRSPSLQLKPRAVRSFPSEGPVCLLGPITHSLMGTSVPCKREKKVVDPNVDNDNGGLVVCIFYLVKYGLPV